MPRCLYDFNGSFPVNFLWWTKIAFRYRNEMCSLYIRMPLDFVKITDVFPIPFLCSFFLVDLSVEFRKHNNNYLIIEHFWLLYKNLEKLVFIRKNNRWKNYSSVKVGSWYLLFLDFFRKSKPNNGFYNFKIDCTPTTASKKYFLREIFLIFRLKMPNKMIVFMWSRKGNSISKIILISF